MTRTIIAALALLALGVLASRVALRWYRRRAAEGEAVALAEAYIAHGGSL